MSAPKSRQKKIKNALQEKIPNPEVTDALGKEVEGLSKNLASVPIISEVEEQNHQDFSSGEEIPVSPKLTFTRVQRISSRGFRIPKMPASLLPHVR